MADQRIKLRPAFRFVNAGNGRRIGCVRSKAVDGFRGQGDWLAAGKLLDGRLQGGFPLVFDIDMTRHDAAFQGVNSVFQGLMESAIVAFILP
ncbi:hypothetical protein D3C87_1559850 [compost metagenome]